MLYIVYITFIFCTYSYLNLVLKLLKDAKHIHWLDRDIVKCFVWIITILYIWISMVVCAVIYW